MSETTSPAVRELLAWIDRRPRTYGQVLEAWRSTCPRLTAWEDALLAGLVSVERGASLDEGRVALTGRGYAVLAGTMAGAAAG